MTNAEGVRSDNTRNNPSLSDYFAPLAGITPFDPPNMKTFVYAPEVRILIARGNKQYDVSRDVIRGTIHRRENSASTLFFSLANNGSYNGLFHRMDRVVVYLKRVRWQQVFSGYLDTVPFAQLYGGEANFKATCTLKRLMHTWWSPGLAKSQSIFNQSLITQALETDGQAAADSGLGGVLRNLVCQVGGWQPRDVYIQNFPMKFFNFMQDQLARKQAANRAQSEKFRQLLLGNEWNQYAPGTYAGYSNSAGPAGPTGAGEAFYISQIVAACDALGLGPRTVDVTNSQQVAQAAAAGAQARDEASRDAFTQVGETAITWNQTAINSDAAILGVACAMVETGGGVTIRNLANRSVPESLRFPHDGFGEDLDSVGIFQQRNQGWGVVSQRMNPRQAATMFFQRLSAISDWRNLPPGDAIQRVQQSAFPEKYAGAIPLAKEKVAAYRQSSRGTTSTIAATPLGNTVTAAGAPIGVNPANTVTASASTPGTPQDIQARLGRPGTDSEGAVQKALEQQGKPYVWGAKGPNAFDCSGLVTWAFRSIGIEVSGNTYSMRDNVPRVLGDPQLVARRGDLLISSSGGHVQIYLGNGFSISAENSSIPVGIYPANLNRVESVHRVAPNGGENPLAFRQDPMLVGPGVPVGTGTYYSGGTSGGQSTEPIAQNLFAFLFEPGRFVNDVAELFSEDHKEFIDAEPLIQMVQAISRAGLRNFASAPDGSFMAYYPDYFGLDGKKAIVQLEDIELRDVKINFSDDNLTTHVYVAGDWSMQGFEANVDVNSWLQTAGSVTVEHDWLFQRLQEIAPGDLGGVDGESLMRKFGVRPLKMPVAMAGGPALEFLLATQLFMEKWAQQYQTMVSFTFLPELFPGMRVILSGHDLQVYVSEVTHTFDWENGFKTDAVIMAPSKTDPGSAMQGISGTFGDPDDSNIVLGLGGFRPDGTNVGAQVGQ